MHPVARGCTRTFRELEAMDLACGVGAAGVRRWLQFVAVPVWDQSIFEPEGQPGSFSSCEGVPGSLSAHRMKSFAHLGFLRWVSFVRPGVSGGDLRGE